MRWWLTWSHLMSTSLTSTSPQMGIQGLGRWVQQEELQQLLLPLRMPTAFHRLWLQPADTQRPGSPSSSSHSNTTAQIHPRRRSRASPEVLGLTLLKQLQQVLMSPTPRSAFHTTALLSPHWPQGLSLQNIPTTSPRGLTTATLAKPLGCTLPSLTWGPPRGLFTLPSLIQPVCRSRTAPRTGSSLSTQLCRGHDR